MQEVKSVSLKMPSLPKMIGELSHSNQFLKLFSLSATVLLFMSLVVIMTLVNKEPLVITLNASGESLQRLNLPKAEDQIRAGIKRYIENRYQWEPSNVVKKLKESEGFITPQALKAFQSDLASVARFSTEKIVSQKAYAEKIEIDLKKNTAFVTGDRVTTIQG